MELSFEHIKLQAIADGSTEAFEWLFMQYQPRLLNFLTGMIHDREVSRDMSQDVFMMLWRDREKLRTVNSFSSYLFQIARYMAYDYFDRLAVSEKYADELLQEPVLAESDEEMIFVREFQSLISQTVNRMSPQRQRVYHMSREEGLSNDEIAQRLGISKRTVENHLTIVLAMLRKVLYLHIVCCFLNVFFE